jgi:hypothetical protein
LDGDILRAMKRDMELIRTILINAEDDKYPYGGRVCVEGYSEETCAYHVALMQDVGLVDAEVIRTSETPNAAARIDRLTSAGHDFCDAIRNDTVWTRAKQKIVKHGTSAGLTVLIEIAKLEVRHFVGL